MFSRLTAVVEYLVRSLMEIQYVAVEHCQNLLEIGMLSESVTEDIKARQSLSDVFVRFHKLLKGSDVVRRDLYTKLYRCLHTMSVPLEHITADLCMKYPDPR
jgi:hypothetical protein